MNKKSRLLLKRNQSPGIKDVVSLESYLEQVFFRTNYVVSFFQASLSNESLSTLKAVGFSYAQG